MKITNVSKEDESMSLYLRGGERNDEYGGCLATGYRGEMTYEGSTQFQKEQQRLQYTSIDFKEMNRSIIGKWIGFKMIVYNFEQNGKISVNMEIWIDEDNDGNWIKIDQWIDSGRWGNAGRRCGGTSDQIITWGGPVAILRLDGVEDAEIKNISIREIHTPITE